MRLLWLALLRHMACGGIAAASDLRAYTGGVCLSITSVVGEDVRAAVQQIVSRVNASALLTARRLVVDADPARRGAASPSDASKYRRAVAALVHEHWLTEAVDVDYSAAYTRGPDSVFQRMFSQPAGPLHSRAGKGFLSYAFEVDTAPRSARYLFHFDSDARLYSDGSRDPVADLVALARSDARLVGAALPAHLGSVNCTLDARDGELRRRAAGFDASGFWDLGAFSTQSAFLDLARLRLHFPLPLKRSNFEDALTALGKRDGVIVAAMLPHSRPPRYFRGEGTRFRREARKADRLHAQPDGPRCERRRF
ncbi:hypothetical protein M885DRAFT_622036 [Pelagophyceae sp. CCMP2097]|nr:hypothetical protein M885DRAFT_622036 [Pelagophyceae sp. CCMP2097]